MLETLLWAAFGVPPAIWLARATIHETPEDQTFATILAGCCLLLGPLAAGLAVLYAVCWASLGLLPEVRAQRAQARADAARNHALQSQSRILISRNQIDREHERLGLPAVHWPPLPDDLPKET